MDLLDGICRYGFTRPSQIQEIGIVPIAQGKNAIIQSQSGTGKTGTFVIGSLAVLDPAVKQVQVVVLSPTHELATQTHHVYCEIASPYLGPSEETARRVELCVGKHVSVEENIMNIQNNGVQVLVGTPGRITHLMKQRIRGKPLVDPESVRIVVLDEADKLLSTDDSRQKINDVVRDLKDAREGPLQFAVVSATFNVDEGMEVARSRHEARSLCMDRYHEYYDSGDADMWLTDPRAPIEIMLKKEKLTLDGIEQFYYDLDCDNNQSFQSKVLFIQTLNMERMIPTCIIYVNNSNSADRLKSELNRVDMVCECIYGDLPPKERMQVTDRFRRGETRILISTDLLARGFDVSQVALVINFDLPYVFDRHRGEISEQKLADYLHRIGRSGRFGRKGVAINIIATQADRMRKRIIEDYYKVPMKVLPEIISDIY